MWTRSLLLLAAASALFAQKVDFKKDVQPIFKANCYGCHGPTQQMNNFRLDRRKDAMHGGTLAQIGPGNAAGSRLYLRLTGSQFGMQMPPTGALQPAQTDIIKRWIDQGADWPDDAAGDAPATPPDAGATRIMTALRNGDAAAFRKALDADAASINRKGPGGSTPLMYAALYSDAAAVRTLLDRKADPNVRNESGATALMWAAGDTAKAKLLIDRGAEVNARSDVGRTPLMIAAGAPTGGDVVKLLLEHHADPNAKAPSLFGDVTPLAEAAVKEPVIRMLIEHGADVKQAGVLPLFISLVAHCSPCSEIFFKGATPETVNMAMIFLAPPLGDASATKMMLERGADPNATDRLGNTILMLTASSDNLPVDSVQALLDRKVDVNAKNPDGLTALDYARKRGQTPVVDLLLKAGAKPGTAAAMPAPAPKPAESQRAAVLRSLPLLQQTDTRFLQGAGCVSCHNNTLTAVTLSSAHKSGFPVDVAARDAQLKRIATYVDSWRERALQGVGIPGDADTMAPILVGMASQGYAADAATDAMAIFIKNQQAPNGMIPVIAHRPPLEASTLAVTAVGMRALQFYAPKARKAEFDQAIERGRTFLLSEKPRTIDDRAYQILGLTWLNGDKAAIKNLASGLIEEQRPDGGWSQIPTIASDAYATGEALVALRDSGVIASTDPVYKKGVAFLLRTQLADGSWYVPTRAIPIQPFFDAKFPHGHDQFISSSATNWATAALLK